MLLPLKGLFAGAYYLHRISIYLDGKPLLGEIFGLTQGKIFISYPDLIENPAFQEGKDHLRFNVIKAEMTSLFLPYSHSNHIFLTSFPYYFFCFSRKDLARNYCVLTFLSIFDQTLNLFRFFYNYTSDCHS